MLERTKAALREKESLFEQQYEKKTLAELSDYLRDCRKSMGRVPGENEVIGGSYIRKRFGSWDAALHSIGAEKNGRERPFRQREIVQREYRNQCSRYRIERTKMQSNTVPQEEQLLELLGSITDGQVQISVRGCRIYRVERKQTGK